MEILRKMEVTQKLGFCTVISTVKDEKRPGSLLRLSMSAAGQQNKLRCHFQTLELPNSTNYFVQFCFVG